jgi:hypothetical protein
MVLLPYRRTDIKLAMDWRKGEELNIGTIPSVTQGVIIMYNGA